MLMPIRSHVLPAVACAALLLGGSGTGSAQTLVASTDVATTAADPGASPAAAPQPADAPAAAPQAAPQQITVSGTSAPEGFRMGDFTLKVGGRVKLDVIRDFK